MQLGLSIAAALAVEQDSFVNSVAKATQIPKMLVEDVLRLSSDAVVELDKAAGDPVDIYVNGRRIARGEVLVLNENFCIRVSEIVESPARTT